MYPKENISLKTYNTFGINAVAEKFISIQTTEQLKSLIQEKLPANFLIIGGGSNILFSNPSVPYVIHIDSKGISKIYEDENKVHLKVMAGENWHQLVLYCIENNYGGIENLSLIPGNVGTAPIQNIGAYGVEIKDVFVSCETLSVHTGETQVFTLEECEFDYRTSVFKTREKGNYIITSVTLCLTKKNHLLKTEYGDIKNYLQRLGAMGTPTIRQISEVVIAIRNSKLPDPKVLGNSGSFFKNPVVEKTVFDRFISKFPEAPFYVVAENQFKIPAGWLIEQSGFKGKRFGDAGVHEKQALVLVNYGSASGDELLSLAKKIQVTVLEKFGIAIEPEVNII